MLGLGPGSLPTDAVMVGLDQSRTRELLAEGTDIIMRLLRDDEPITFKNDRWDLQDARLHLRPWSDPHFEVAVAAVASPAGPQLAGRYGIGLLSIGATQAVGFDALALHWGVMEERAAKFGATVDRSAWRLVGLMHIAETREQAYKDVEFGIEQWFHYFQAVAAFPQIAVGGDNIKEMIDFVNSSGLGSIGTVEDAVEQIERLMKQSNGGFGCYLLLAHEWANPEATRRSFELIAQHVFPQFQGQAHSTNAAKARAEASRPEMAAAHMKAVEAVTASYQAEVASKG
jgi:limonene 1,2-monooxygenase